VPFQPIESQRLYQRVAHQIADLIRSGEIAEGQRLPSERELCKRLGVSRPIVREAMIALEIEGFVEIRIGSGVFVRNAVSTVDVATRPGWQARFDAGPGPFELLSARLVIEPEVAAEAARQATRQEAEELLRTVEALESARDHHHSLEVDRQFHCLLGSATRNSVLAAIVEDLWAGMFTPMFEAISSSTGLIDTDEMTVSDHRTIVQAVLDRSPLAARRAMISHLEKVRGILDSIDDYENELELEAGK
jgi:DNA-binding FadR family transcriptional regulator